MGKVRAEVAIAVRDVEEEGAVGEVVMVYRAKLLEGEETALNLTQVGCFWCASMYGANIAAALGFQP